MNTKRKRAGFAELSASLKVYPHFKNHKSKVRATNKSYSRQICADYKGNRPERWTMNRISISLSIGFGIIVLGVILLSHLKDMAILSANGELLFTSIIILAVIGVVLYPLIFRVSKTGSGHASNEALSSSVSRDFKALFIYAKSIEMLGWLILLGGLGFGVLGIIGKVQIQLLFAVASMIGGFVIGISMVLTAQSILVILQIENNTRQNAKHFEIICDLLQKSLTQS